MIIFADDFSGGLGAWSAGSEVRVVMDDGRPYSVQATWAPGESGFRDKHFYVDLASRGAMDEVYIQFEYRYSAYVGTKFCKVHGLETESTGYANTTFSVAPDGRVRVQHGPGTSLQNDTMRHLISDGTWTGGAPPGSMTTGTEGRIAYADNRWHTLRARVRFHDEGEAVYEIWSDGERRLIATGFSNRHSANLGIEFLSLFDWSNGEHEGGTLSYANLVVSVGGWVD